MLSSLPCLEFFKPPRTRHLCTGSTASPSPTVMWATSVRGGRFLTDRSRTRLRRLLSLSLSRARRQTINPAPRLPGMPLDRAAVLDLRPSSPLCLAFRPWGPCVFRLPTGISSRFHHSLVEELLEKLVGKLVSKKFTFEVFYFFPSHSSLGASKTVQKKTCLVQALEGERWAIQSTGGGRRGVRRPLRQPR